MDFPFDIYDVCEALVLNIVRQHPKSIDVDCPFCSGHGKMNLNVEKNIFRCNKCGENGGMLDLYCRVTSTSDKKEAYRVLSQDRSYSYYVEQRKHHKEIVSSIKEANKADKDTINRTYRALLGSLDLSEKHRQNLLNRGLTEAQIKKWGYKSVPTNNYEQLLSKLNCTLIGVPGFYTDKDVVKLNISQKAEGFFVPIFDCKNRIRAMQLRLDNPLDQNRKYMWLSSSEKQNGCGSKSPLQICGNVLNSKTLYITEGGLKATIAHELSHKTFIGVAGVNQIKNLESVFDYLRGKEIVIVDTFDMDDDINEQVRKAHKSLMDMAVSYGFITKRILWDKKYKGIDDYLLAAKNRR